MTTRKQIQPSEVTAVIDTREQSPLDVSPLQMVSGTLDTGDYSIVGLEHVVRLERKTLPDLVTCCGRERGRFDREVARLLAYPVRALLVESTWADLERGDWRGKVTPNHVVGSLLGWIASGLQVHMCGDHHRAGQHAARILFTVARRRHREFCEFTKAQERSEVCQ